MYHHALKLSRLAMLTLAGVAVSASAIAADSAPTSQIGPTAEAYIVSHPDKVGEVVATYLAEHPEFLVDAPRDKRTYFREINYIAAAFQYQKKNYKSA